MIKKNDVIDVRILNLGLNGEGVARHDGVVLFVPFALDGELVKVQVINTKQKAYICKVLEILEPSKDRVESKCPYYKKCGGCQLQYLNYLKTLEFKRELVQNAIIHIGKQNIIVEPCVASDKQYGYRNKIALPVNPVTRKVGMYRVASHSMVDIDNCAITQDWAKNIINAFNDYLDKTDVSIFDGEKGLIKHLVVRQANGKLLITIVVNGDDLPHDKVFIDNMSRCFDNFGLNININKLNNNVILGEKYKHIYGLKDIEIEEYGVKYSLTNASFMQVNDYIKHAIYDRVLEEIGEKDIVIDAYSGAGLLTAIVSKKCSWAYGLEIVKPAVESADNLARLNSINNMTNICGDVAKELPKVIKKLKGKSVVILDPPRKGCDKSVIESLASAKPDKIIYISCNPSTLARDIYNLAQFTNEYDIVSVTPFDMFPQTKHVETLAILKRK